MREAWEDVRIQKLAHLVLELSERGAIEWEPVDFDGLRNGFGFSADHGTVIVGSRDGDGTFPYFIEVRNEDDVPVEVVELFRLDSTERPARAESALDEPDGPAWAVDRTELAWRFRDLYRLARRTALGTDDLLDRLIGELEELNRRLTR